MTPHRDLSVDMHEPEEGTLTHPLLSGMCVLDLDLEVCVRFTCLIETVPCCELGVGGHSRASNVVCQKSRVCCYMTKPDDILMTNDTTSPGLRNLLCRLDDPMIVRVVQRMEGIPSDLLSWVRERYLSQYVVSKARMSVILPVLEIRPSSYLRG